MAIKIQNSTIIDDDRSIVNASRAGIGTAIAVIPYDNLNQGTLSFEASEGQLFSITNNLTSGSIFSVNDVSGIPSIDVDADGTIDIAQFGGNVNIGGNTLFNGEKVYYQDVTIDNNGTSISLQSDIVVDDGNTLTVSTGSTIVLNPFDFENSSVDELLVDRKLVVGVSSSFDVVSSGVGSVSPTSTTLTGSGIDTTNNVSLGLLVKPIPGIIGAGTTITGIGANSVTISPASLNTTVQEDITFKFGFYGENKSGIILDGETQTITFPGRDGNTDGGTIIASVIKNQSSVTNNIELDSAGNLKFDSGYGKAEIAYGCRAWVNFNGTGTVAIRASGNVSSITDNGVGYYTVNFTTAMPDTDYATCGLNDEGIMAEDGGGGTRTAGGVGVYMYLRFDTFTPIDANFVSVAVFR